MNLQEEDKTIGQDQELLMEKEKHLWILGSQKIIMTKMESLNTSTAMSINI